MTKAKQLDAKPEAPFSRGDLIEFFDGLRWDAGTVTTVKWSNVSGWWVEASCDRGTWQGQSELVRRRQS